MNGLTSDLIQVLDTLRAYGTRASASGLTRLQLLELALMAERVAATHAVELDALRSVDLQLQAEVPHVDGVPEDELIEAVVAGR